MSVVMDLVTVFTSPLCGMCAVAKKWLADLGVGYREIDVAVTPDARRHLRRIADGYVSVPTFVFADGTTLVEPTREALIQALSARWEREGIVRGGQPRIELIDEDRLRRIAQREPEQRRAT